MPGRSGDPRGRDARRRQRCARPRLADATSATPVDVDWNRTICANLRHYQPDLELETVIVEMLIGYGRRQQAI
jgi:hypothetical protein